MKKAIVIGATSGIGRETAVRLVDEGWEVGVSGRRIEALEAFRKEYGERVHFRQMDVTWEDATARLDALIEEMGAPDLLLYVSGVGYQNRELDIRPGFVATDILNPDKKYPMLLTLQKAADEVMKAIRRKRRIYTFDWKFRILVFFWRLVPRCIWERLTWVKN